MINTCQCGKVARVSGMCYACYHKKRRQINPEKSKKKSKEDYEKYKKKHALERALRAFFIKLGGRPLVGRPLYSGRSWRVAYVCSKCHKQKKGNRVFYDNAPYCLGCANQIRDRKKADELFKIAQAQSVIDTIDPFGAMKEECTKLGTCDILHFHHELLKDDPERMTTDFLIKVICGEEKVKQYKEQKEKMK